MAGTIWYLLNTFSIARSFVVQLMAWLFRLPASVMSPVICNLHWSNMTLDELDDISNILKFADDAEILKEVRDSMHCSLGCCKVI